MTMTIPDFDNSIQEGARYAIECAGGKVTVEKTETQYILSGPTGSHSLTINCTPPARLLAHLEGFVANNGGAVRPSITWSKGRQTEWELIDEEDYNGPAKCLRDINVLLNGEWVGVIEQVVTRPRRYESDEEIGAYIYDDAVIEWFPTTERDTLRAAKRDARKCFTGWYELPVD